MLTLKACRLLNPSAWDMVADHDPAHVHVVKAGGEARIKLGLRGRAPEIMTLYKMSNRDAAQALDIFEKHHEELVEKWRDIHGK